MIGPHYTLTCTLQVLTPLHIGTGESQKFERFAGDNEKPELSMAALDSAGKPYLPGASIKGVLRQLAGANREVLFGPDNIEDGTSAKAGSVIVWNAKLDQAPPDAKHAPYGELKLLGDVDGLASRGLTIDARTAIDPETGVADDRKLFHQLLVLPGTMFHFSMTLHHQANENMQFLAGTMAGLLGQMASDDGIALGRGTRVGLGRVRLLEDTVKVTSAPKRFVDGAAVKSLLEKIKPQAQVDAAEVEAHLLHLVCDGPYLVSDSSKIRKKTDAGDQSKEPHLNPLVEPDGNAPRLPGSSLAGVLRARALWLASLRDPEADDDRGRVLAEGEDPCNLSSIERLFGVTGWRGLVQIDQVRFVGRSQPLEITTKDITSVRLDRFSGAPIDGALFTTRAWLEPEFEVKLSLIDRTYKYKGQDKQALQSGDKALFQRLVEDIKAEGLMIGHGTNKGYGWFDVTQASREATA